MFNFEISKFYTVFNKFGLFIMSDENVVLRPPLHFKSGDATV